MAEQAHERLEADEVISRAETAKGKLVRWIDNRDVVALGKSHGRSYMPPFITIEGLDSPEGTVEFRHLPVSRISYIEPIDPSNP